jgi:glycosidase
VQAKHIAAAKALIESADIDGFRIDTPMQVDLGFFKAWAPELKRWAAAKLNKTNFGLWGEFYTLAGRYSTMTGRGKDNTMYGNPAAFIDEVATLNGGIDYAFYDYIRHHLLRNEIGEYPVPAEYRDRHDGLTVLWAQEMQMLDLVNPQTGRLENTMWRFCNNHDQWRMQALVDGKGLDLFKACLGLLTFTPGIPLHYAGDEQGFATYGTALDGWAREELSLSAAWTGMDIA